MKIIPATVCEQAGIVVPVHMSELAYDRIMASKNYLAILAHAKDMKLALTAAAIKLEGTGLFFGDFTVPYDGEPLDLHYNVTEGDDGQVFMEIYGQKEGYITS